MQKTHLSRLSRRSVLAGALLSVTPAFGAMAECLTKKHKRALRMNHSPFDRDRFVEDCVSANAEGDGQASVGEVLKRAVRDHSAVLAVLG